MDFVTWDDDSQYIEKNDPNVPNHQPVMISYDTYIYISIRTIHSMYLPLGYGKTHGKYGDSPWE